MSALLPPSTNGSYRGAQSSAWFLGAYGVLWIVPGLVHSFLPDGGSETIAGLAPGGHAPMVRALFAWAGATQIAHGAATLVVALRYRTLVPLFLAVSLVERALLSWSGWVRHVPANGHHPPEHYGSLVSLPLILLFLWLSLRDRD